MDIRDQLRSALRVALHDAGLANPPADIGLERPRLRAHGDWSSNVALVNAPALGRNPRQLGQEIVDCLLADPPRHVAAVKLAGPGFVNFHLASSWLHQVLRQVVADGVDGYARHQAAASQGSRSRRTVNVEFVSANPTGPLHAGHGRWAAYGDSLCRLLERCGHDVSREFYVNDRGLQTELFGQSLAARKQGREPAADGYLGGYVAEWAEEMPDDADPRTWGIERARCDQAATLQSMQVRFDRWVSEQDLLDRGIVAEVLAELRSRGLVYESAGAVWLRCSDWGDDQDRVLVKSNGEPTYFLPDIAYHHDKHSRGDVVIDILGADHHGYVGRMRAAMLALGHDPAGYEVLIGQNVTLVRDGVEVRLAKRAGNIVLVSDLIDEVGADVTRLSYLLQSIDSTQTIDLDLISAQSSENPVYYVQYANARVHSVFRQAGERGIRRPPLDDVDLAVLDHDRELALLRTLSELPDTVRSAGLSRAPHRIATWTQGLAGEFHRFWHDCSILGDDLGAEVRSARLWLVEATRIGLAIGLNLLGVSAPERM